MARERDTDRTPSPRGLFRDGRPPRSGCASPTAAIDAADRKRSRASAAPARARAAPQTKPSGTRTSRDRGARSVMPCELAAAERRSTAASTSATVDVARHHDRCVAAALVMALADVVPRDRARSSGDHGPLRCGTVGPKMPTIGVPTAAAMCIGPVSPDTISARRAASATRSAIVGRRREHARRRPTPSTTASASASSPGPHSTTDSSPCTLAQKRRELAEALGRPALVRPRRAGIEQRERPIAAERRANARQRRRRRPPRAETRSSIVVDAERPASSRDSSRRRASAVFDRRQRTDFRCRTGAPPSRAGARSRSPTTRAAPEARASTADLSSPCRSIATS